MKTTSEPKGISPSAIAGVRIKGSLLAALWTLLAGIAVAFSRLDRCPSPWPQLTVIPLSIGVAWLAVVARRYLHSRRERPPVLFLTSAGTTLDIRFAFADPAFEGRRIVAVTRCDRDTTWPDGEMTTQSRRSARCGMTVRSGQCEGQLDRPAVTPKHRSPGTEKVTYRWFVDLNCGGYVHVYAI
jgi:hypothetical protein